MTDHSQSVLIVQPWLDYRGAERQSLQLLQDLPQRGVPARLICLYISDAISSEVDRATVILPYVFIQRLMHFRTFYLIFGFWVLLFLLLKHGRSFSVYNAQNFPSMWVCVFGKLFFGHKKIVWVVHNFPQHPFRGVFGAFVDRCIAPIERILVRCVDVVLPVSQKVSRQVTELFGVDSIVLHPGIDTAFFKEHSHRIVNRFQHIFPPNAVIMLHVGRICEEKMQAYSVDVLRLLLDACPDLVLVFAGDGTLRIVDDRVRHRCFFLGITPRAELAYLYSFSQFLLYPSSWGEGCTVVPFEALASGTQFVCIAKGCGADELLAHTSNAFLFDALSEREALLQFIKKTYAARTHIEPYGFDYLDRTVYAQRFMETGHLCTLAHR